MLPAWLRAAIEPHPDLAGPPPVPFQFKDATLERIPSVPLQQLVRRYGGAFWDEAAKGTAPLLLGPPGTYKSYAAAVLVRRLHAKACIKTAWCTVPIALTGLERDRFSEQTRERIAAWKRSPFLVCDDFAMVRIGSWQHDVLVELTMDRFESGKPTLWTGNVTVPKGKQDFLADVVGAQLARRMLERSEGYRLYVQKH